MRCAALASLLVAHAAAASPFVSLDRTAGTTQASAELGLQFFEDHDNDGGEPDVIAGRLDLHGEYKLSAHDGVLATLPLVFVDAGLGSHAGVGGAHIGGYHRFALGGATKLVLRAGLELPSDHFIPRGKYDEHIAVHGTLFPWLEERAVTGGVLWAKLGPSMRFTRGPVNAQLDLLVDVPLAPSPYDLVDGLPVRVHAGAGVAYTRGALTLAGELLGSGYMLADMQMVPFTNDLRIESEPGDDDTFIVATASARWRRPGYELAAWFANPLDAFIRLRYHVLGIGVSSPW